MAGANQDAIAAVREGAFRAIEFTDQETGTTAVNGIPTTALDGVALDGKSSFSYQAVVTAGTGNAEITIWGFANGEWNIIHNHRDIPIDSGGIVGGQIGFGGIFTRVYIEISVYSEGTLTLTIGVPKP